MKHVVLLPGAGVRRFEWVDSLKQALGPDYDIVAPEMPDPDEPHYEPWKQRLEQTLSPLSGDLILVGQSFGGSVLLKYLAENDAKKNIVGVITIAAPFFGGEDTDWNVAEYNAPKDFSRLVGIPRILLQHSRDDEEVPFAHVSEYARKLPQATVRVLEGRGHDLKEEHLSELIEDIRSLES